MGEVVALPQDEAAEPVRAVFDYWRDVMGHPRARMDDKRERVIRAMLATGYSVDDLKDAIDGCADSAWHRGANDRNTVYDSLGIILKDADHVDRFIELGERLHRKIRASLAEKDRKAGESKDPRGPMPEHLREQVRAYLRRKNEVKPRQ